MPRYIDTDELLNRLPDDLPYKASVKRVLIQAPAADVVEVVRCKDCLKYKADAINMDVGWCEEFERGIFEECFCSYGERKE